MAKLNKAVKCDPIETHEGGRAVRINPLQALRRSVCACMLWENEFYEEGTTIAQRIAELITKVKPEQVAELAVEARETFKLRHVPLLLVRELARTGFEGTAKALAQIIQRPDELCEFLALYWKDGRCKLSAQVKKGLALAFPKFNEYQLAKYNRGEEIKLRDVLFLSHAVAMNKEQERTWRRLIGTYCVCGHNHYDPQKRTVVDKCDTCSCEKFVRDVLPAPDTWEVALSSGADKKATWERLLSDTKLGALALLRNLRNMNDVGVSQELIFAALEKMKIDRVLPFRFISAARYAPQWEPQLEASMLKCLELQDRLPGHTVMLLDVSSSMDHRLSDKSDITRLDAACGVAMLLREICEKVDVFSFSMELKQIPPRRGFALRDAIVNSQKHSGTPLGLAIASIYEGKKYHVTDLSFQGYGHHQVDYWGQDLKPDRIVVFTDEQSADAVPNPQGKGYMINVASAKNGVGYGAWTHIDGFSEAVIGWVREYESLK
jgi:60 kDa SS-A/Ro ribonucleoprotein